MHAFFDPIVRLSLLVATTLSLSVSAESLPSFSLAQVELPEGASIATISVDVEVDLCNAHQLTVTGYTFGTGPLGATFELALVSSTEACETEETQLTTLTLRLDRLQAGDHLYFAYNHVKFQNFRIDYQ